MSEQMTIIKFKSHGDFKITGCDSCPFMDTWPVTDEWGTLTMETDARCVITNTIADVDHMGSDEKLEDCPLISVENKDRM